MGLDPNYIVILGKWAWAYVLDKSWALQTVIRTQVESLELGRLKSIQESEPLIFGEVTVGGCLCYVLPVLITSTPVKIENHRRRSCILSDSRISIYILSIVYFSSGFVAAESTRIVKAYLLHFLPWYSVLSVRFFFLIHFSVLGFHLILLIFS